MKPCPEMNLSPVQCLAAGKLVTTYKLETDSVNLISQTEFPYNISIHTHMHIHASGKHHWLPHFLRNGFLRAITNYIMTNNCFMYLESSSWS